MDGEVVVGDWVIAARRSLVRSQMVCGNLHSLSLTPLFSLSLLILNSELRMI